MKTTSGQDATTRPRNLTAEENNSNAIDILLDGRPIATVIDEDGDDVTAEMRELAGLFVAAPEMRDLLEAIQFHNRSKIQAWREKYGYDFPDYAATSDMARKAIDLVLAKAGGQ